MPEFYNRFQGRTDLMEYAKVGPVPAISPTLTSAPWHLPPRGLSGLEVRG